MCSYNNTPGPQPKIPIYTIFGAPELHDPIRSGMDEYFASTCVLPFPFHLQTI